jgi:hypothetical protein
VQPAARLSLLLLVGLCSCDSKKESPPEPSASATREPMALASSPAPSPVASRAGAPALSVSAAPAAAASASAAPSANAASPCPANAKNYAEPKFCVVLPEKTLDITYEGDEKEGQVELEPKGGGVIRFSWVPVARAGTEPLKAQLERVSDGYELVESGDLPRGGAWSDWKKASGDEKTEHVVQSVVKTPKLLINCNYTTTADRVEEARKTCKSVRGY